MEYKIATRQCADESMGVHRFDYHLIVELASSQHFSCELYGIHIMDDQGNDAVISGITTSPTQIDELMTLLVDHQVGPIGLADVVEDWLAAKKSGAGLLSGTAG